LGSGSAANNITQICYKLQHRGWNVGTQQQQQVCTTLSAIFISFYTVSHYIYLCRSSILAVLLTVTFTLKTILLTNNVYDKKTSAFASIYLLASIIHCNLFFYLFLLKITRVVFLNFRYNTTFFAKPVSDVLIDVAPSSVLCFH